MINLESYPMFSKKKSTLKKTSKNDADTKDIKYMTECEYCTIDFDKIKECYIKTLSLNETPKSNDALLEFKGELYFIEFKDGNMKKEIYNVKRKIFESLLIFCDIINENISFTRENMNYMLVYNSENSEKYVQEIIDNRKKSEKKVLNKDEILETNSFDNFSRIMGDLSNYQIDIFGLRNQFEKMYFKKVYTYDKSDFNNKFVQQLI